MRPARLARLVPLAVIALASVIFSPCVTANIFGDQDYLLLRNLSQRTEVFRRDILDSQRALLYDSQSYQCLDNISRDLENVDANLSESKTLISISGQMVNNMDESFVNKYITEEINYGLKLLSNLRKSVNLSAGHCSNSAIVTTKAQYVLSLFTEIENAFGLLARRI
jgi:hypothetical protein